MKAAFVLIAALLLGACQTTKPAGISAACANEIADVEHYNRLLVERGLPPSIVLNRHCRAEQLAGQQIEDTRPTSVNYIARPKGPQVAKGAVIFINGIDFRNRTHHYDDTTPDILHWFLAGGFDVYRLDLAPNDQAPFGRIFAAMSNTISDMRRQNYRRVYVVGQSAGGVAALISVSRERPVQSDGAIAIAVGGVNALESPQLNLQAHRDILSEIRTDKRTAVFHFREDELLGRWHNEAVALSRSKLDGRRNAMVRVPPGVTGHYAMDDSAFLQTYGRCLTEFLAADDPDGSICPP
jgi:hypothetical protein